jgi:hypothetical protein
MAFTPPLQAQEGDRDEQVGKGGHELGRITRQPQAIAVGQDEAEPGIDRSAVAAAGGKAAQAADGLAEGQGRRSEVEGTGQGNAVPGCRIVQVGALW